MGLRFLEEWFCFSRDNVRISVPLVHLTTCNLACKGAFLAEIGQEWEPSPAACKARAVFVRGNEDVVDAVWMGCSGKNQSALVIP